MWPVPRRLNSDDSRADQYSFGRYPSCTGLFTARLSLRRGPATKARMRRSPGRRMRDYWDERACTNAAWYVDTSIDFAEPDMDRFFATGETIVGEALDGAPASPPAYGVAVEIGAGL